MNPGPKKLRSLRPSGLLQALQKVGPGAISVVVVWAVAVSVWVVVVVVCTVEVEVSTSVLVTSGGTTVDVTVRVDTEVIRRVVTTTVEVDFGRVV